MAWAHNDASQKCAICEEIDFKATSKLSERQAMNEDEPWLEAR